MNTLRTIRSYVQAVPSVLKLQLVSKTVLGLLLFLCSLAAGQALASQGRVAVTTGDFLFLFTSWQGWLLVALGLATLYLYMALDLNAKLNFAGHWVDGDDVPTGQLVREGLAATRRFLNPRGMLVVLYVALLAPILGVGVSFTLTENLAVPTFITSVIEATPLYSAAYAVFAVVFTLVVYLDLFVVHGVVLDGLTVGEAHKRSRELMRAHWKQYLLQSIGFMVREAVVLVAAVAAVVALWGVVLLVLGATDPFGMYTLLSGGNKERFALLFLCFMGSMSASVAGLLLTPFMLIKLTRLYRSYLANDAVEVALRPSHVRPWLIAGRVLMGVGSLLLAWMCNMYFDLAFSPTSDVRVIAHRACGSEGAENTVAGLDTAAAAGSWGAEIDIQRTLDGAYVVNHDGNFKRVAGDERKPSQMTLAEVRKLRVTANPADPNAAGEPVATYEEMLDGARDRLVLFVELKGETADHQMADDAVHMARERNMLDQCVFISLDYELIDYLEDTYPEAKTGFLAFASYGDTAALNCDYLALEEQAARRATIDAVHEQGKGVLVWTVNSEESQHHFLLSGVDAIITDNMTQAQEVRAQLAQRSDFERIIDQLTSSL